MVDQFILADITLTEKNAVKKDFSKLSFLLVKTRFNALLTLSFYHGL